MYDFVKNWVKSSFSGFGAATAIAGTFIHRHFGLFLWSKSWAVPKEAIKALSAKSPRLFGKPFDIKFIAVKLPYSNKQESEVMHKMNH